MHMLEQIAFRVRHTEQRVMQILQVVKPLANSMFDNHAVDPGEMRRMIQELERQEDIPLDRA
jgi:hypothetical protein